MQVENHRLPSLTLQTSSERNDDSQQFCFLSSDLGWKVHDFQTLYGSFPARRDEQTLHPLSAFSTILFVFTQKPLQWSQLIAVQVQQGFDCFG